jgi:hypothetical protein
MGSSGRRWSAATRCLPVAPARVNSRGRGLGRVNYGDAAGNQWLANPGPAHGGRPVSLQCCSALGCGIAATARFRRGPLVHAGSVHRSSGGPCSRCSRASTTGADATVGKLPVWSGCRGGCALLSLLFASFRRARTNRGGATRCHAGASSRVFRPLEQPFLQSPLFLERPP